MLAPPCPFGNPRYRCYGRTIPIAKLPLSDSVQPAHDILLPITYDETPMSVASCSIHTSFSPDPCCENPCYALHIACVQGLICIWIAMTDSIRT